MSNECPECARMAKELEAAKESWTRGYEKGRQSTASRLVERDGVLMTEHEAIEKLQSQLEQARQHHKVMKDALLKADRYFKADAGFYDCDPGLSKKSAVHGVNHALNVIEAAPPLPASRVKLLEAVAEAAKHLLRNYLKCPQYPENVEIHARILNPMRDAVVALDAPDAEVKGDYKLQTNSEDAPDGEKEKRDGSA